MLDVGMKALLPLLPIEDMCQPATHSLILMGTLWKPKSHYGSFVKGERAFSSFLSPSSVIPIHAPMCLTRGTGGIAYFPLHQKVDTVID